MHGATIKIVQMKTYNVITRLNVTVRGVETCAGGRKIEFQW